MRRLRIGQAKLPEIYVVSDRAEVAVAREYGIPYLVKPAGWDDEKLVKAVMMRMLWRRFPAIEWEQVLGISHHERESLTIVSPVTRKRVKGSNGFTASSANTGGEGYRGLDDDGTQVSDDDDVEWARESLDHAIGTTWEEDVSIEELQRLKVLPTFLDDIATAIKRNLIGLQWHDGWNKKLGAPMGRVGMGSQAPNLMVLDVSGSIPGGVSKTMVTLIDTLRTQANADLIVTGDRSKWFGINDAVDPYVVAECVGGCNEATQFYKILADHVCGRHFGNVVVFGDDDAPDDDRFRHDQKNKPYKKMIEAGTRFDNLLAFDTHFDKVPGYGLFVTEINPDIPIEYNHDWVKVMKRRLR